MGKLPSNYRKRSDQGQPGGYQNRPAPTTGPSEKQIDLILDLHSRVGHEPPSLYELSVLSPRETREMIADLKRQLPPPDPDACPDNWDKDIWNLTLLFEAYARADKIELHHVRRFIYAEISSLVERHDMRGKAEAGRYRQEVEYCSRRLEPASMATRCWYHWPPDKAVDQEAGVLAWQQMVEIIMAEFWSRIQDEFALDTFRRFFRDYGREAMEHWTNLRVAKRCEERRAMMAADSKEG